MRSAICAALTTLLLTVGGCGPIYVFGAHWDLGDPMALAVDSPELPADRLQDYFAFAVQQLGGRAEAGARQVAHIRLSTPDYPCYGCTPRTVEHVDYNGDTIWVLPLAMQLGPDALEDLVTHGLGHVLGYQSHLPSETHDMMTPLYCDRDAGPTMHRLYQPADLDALCGAGRLSGGVCATR